LPVTLGSVGAIGNGCNFFGWSFNVSTVKSSCLGFDVFMISPKVVLNGLPFAPDNAWKVTFAAAGRKASGSLSLTTWAFVTNTSALSRFGDRLFPGIANPVPKPSFAVVSTRPTALQRSRPSNIFS
jgi:hypothetical protein